MIYQVFSSLFSPIRPLDIIKRFNCRGRIHAAIPEFLSRFSQVSHVALQEFSHEAWLVGKHGVWGEGERRDERSAHGDRAEGGVEILLKL